MGSRNLYQSSVKRFNVLARQTEHLATEAFVALRLCQEQSTPSPKIWARAYCVSRSLRKDLSQVPIPSKPVPLHPTPERSFSSRYTLTIPVTIVDSVSSIIALLDILEKLPVELPFLYLDLEGPNLCRHGSISVMQIYVKSIDQLFIVDVHLLGTKAFSTPNRSGTTLQSILQSKLLPKVAFDIRNGAGALFAHFNMSMRGVEDLQLMEVATRSTKKYRMSELAASIGRDAHLAPDDIKAWKVENEKGLALFEPKSGGSYKNFSFRPMTQEIIDYCANKIAYLPLLRQIYSQKLGKKWRLAVKEETHKRLLMSQDVLHDPHGGKELLSPWAQYAKRVKRKTPGKKADLGAKDIGNKLHSAQTMSVTVAT